jgi:peptidoglycan/LPS O-acetylase OafA/YrhL
MALLRITTEFVAGAMLWKAWSLAGEPRSIKWDVIAVAIVILTVVGLAVLPREESFGLVLTPMLAFLVVACASATGPVKWVLSTRLVMFGGQISYSLYMVHFLVLIVVGKVLPWSNFENASLLMRIALMTFYFVTCFAIAVACYLFLEEPARRVIHRAAERRALRRRVPQT